MTPTASNLPDNAIVQKRGLLPISLEQLQPILTGLCGLFLAVSFFPGAGFVAFLSVAAGSYFALKSAYDSLKDRILDVNFLMVLAAVGAIVVGQVRDAAALLFLFSLSTTMESFAMAKTKAAIEKLVQLRPTTALRMKGEDSERVPVEELVVDDIILIPSFEKIPLDGIVISGSSSVDESALTGESRPVAKTLESPIVAGTQNLEGTLHVKVTQVVGSSTLDRIIAMVQEAQDNKASGEKVSQWFGQRYTIFVLVAFGLAWIYRSLSGQSPPDAFYSALVLLVGLSPCALVISTPASTLSALAKAARSGILVRGGEFIERVAEVDIVAMDKTGTLTEGRPKLLSFAIWDGSEQLTTWESGQEPTQNGSDFLAATAAIEAHSTHPLGKALVGEAKERKLSLPLAEDAVTLPGLGISCTVQGAKWLVGNDKLLIGEDVAIPDNLMRQALDWKNLGRTTVFAAGTGKVGVFSFGDKVRPDAGEVVAKLRELGVKRIIMLTGDKHETAQVIAAQVGVTEVLAELMPGDKSKKIEELSRQGKVMMVGDGVNDAPSLAGASVGVAMGGLGSDVALEAADIVLMNDRLASIPDIIHLGRRTKRVIMTNLGFALGMILVLSISSFLVKLPLPIAVLGHEGSTVLVILNGLRLLK